MTEEPNNGDWQAPPPPEKIIKEEPQMSEVSTLVNVFFDPGNTFEDLRKKPRFILALLITVLFFGGYIIAFQQKLGEQRYRQFITEQIEKNPQASSMPAEQKQAQINISVTITKYIGYAIPVFIVVFSFIGGLFYWLGAKAMGGAATFMQSLSVYVYSSFAPTVVSMLANFIVLFLKSADEIDIATSSRGVVQASPAMFMNGKDMPVLTTLVSSLDLFAIWGLILAAIGLQKVGKISKGSAWTIVLIIFLIGITWRVINALISGNPS
ncbi:MAG TPA: Yip1 family protein [Pyrinomonadaceae bacterium]|nr:Yip1 family protein [Pyrinomonadaceae bacterium]